MGFNRLSIFHIGAHFSSDLWLSREKLICVSDPQTCACHLKSVRVSK